MECSTNDSSAEEVSYQKLSDRAFFWHAILLHGFCLFLAITVQKIDMIFDLAGAICCAFSIFLFPALGYLIASYRFGGRQQQQQQDSTRTCETWLYQMSSCAFLAIGLLLIMAAFYINILRVSGMLPAEDGWESLVSWEKEQFWILGFYHAGTS